MQNMNKSILIITIAVFRFSVAMPATRVETDPELTAGYEEGDMVLDMNTRNGWRSEAKRWPNATVYYKFFTKFDDPHKNHILQAMKILERVSCVRFKEANDEVKTFINITGFDGGCYSNVGYLNRGAQICNLQVFELGKGCFRLGSILHELLHSLGFFHMQTAPNRDRYVRIIRRNIQERALRYFRKINIIFVDDFDAKYDYGSVLHFPAYAYSANGGETIKPVKDTEDSRKMGQRSGMSKSDIKKLNVMYRCPVSI